MLTPAESKPATKTHQCSCSPGYRHDSARYQKPRQGPAKVAPAVENYGSTKSDARLAESKGDSPPIKDPEMRALLRHN